jgi:predicted cupin superfamily sugar epimerase
MALELQELIKLLDLHPLEGEGGLYAETYRSTEHIPQSALPARYAGGGRAYGTAIYYLLNNAPDSFSALHRLKTDEIYHFYLGDPIELLLLFPDGMPRVVQMGQDLRAGQYVQFVVPAGTWQGSRLLPGGTWALLGTSMAPGFDFADFEAGERAKLSDAYPSQRLRIIGLTRA